jgi:uncharacterized protein
VPTIGAPGKGSCALQRADGQPNELPAVPCRGHAGKLLLSDNGPSGLAPDKVLSAKAQAAGVPPFSEFAVKDDDVTWFGSMSPKQDLQFLRHILDEVLASPSAQAATYTEWGRGDFRRARGVVARIKQLYPELHEILVLDRNCKWVPRIKKMLPEKRPAMVVLGHFHLVRSDGVLAQLQAAGMTVRRV